MEHNITVNAYAPGLISTKLIESEHDVHFGGEPGAAAKHVSLTPVEPYLLNNCRFNPGTEGSARKDRQGGGRSRSCFILSVPWWPVHHRWVDWYISQANVLVSDDSCHVGQTICMDGGIVFN